MSRMKVLSGIGLAVAATLVVLVVLTMQRSTVQGVQDASDDLRQWTAQQLAQVAPSVKPQDERLFVAPAEYLPDQIVPFALSRLTQALYREVEVGNTKMQSHAARLSAEQKRHKQELENYPLDAMTMQGSLQRQGEIVALVKVHQTLHPIRLGQYLGQNYGQVVQITEQHIQLRELLAVPGGEWVEKTSTLTLSEEGAS